MEALAVAASIAGLAALGIQLFDKLQGIVAEHSDQTGHRQFAADLASSESLLLSVEELAKNAQKLHPSSSCGMVLSSLQIQLEDYTNEIKEWLERGRHLAKPLSAGTKSGSKTGTKDLFSRLTRQKVGSKTIKERLAFYEDKISMSLDIVGRELDIDNNIMLDSISSDVHSAVELVTREASKVAEKLDELSSSSNSVLSHSRSSSRKLDDISSGINSLKGEFHDLRSMLLDFVSSTSSQSTKDDQETRTKNRHPSAQNPPTKSAAKRPSQARGVEISAQVDSDGVSVSSAGSNPKPHVEHEAEFEPLLQVTNTISKSVRHLYPPLVSEYVSMIVAWQLLGRFQDAVSQQKTSIPAGSGVSTADEKRREAKMRRLARRLFAIRQFCVREDLGKDVEQVETAFGVTEETLETWYGVVDKLSEKQRRWLEILASRSNLSKEERDRNWALRINIWLFQTLDAYPEYVELHRQIFVSSFRLTTPRLPTTRELRPWEIPPVPIDPSADMKVLYDGEDWKQKMRRYWFLDGAAGGVRDADSQSHVPETEATFRPIEDEEHGKGLSPWEGFSLGATDVGQDNKPPTRASTNADSLLAFNEPLPGVTLKATARYFENVNTCSDGISQSRWAVAVGALKDYGSNMDDLMFPAGSSGGLANIESQ
ncbi:hypothetical protein OQA88_7374 [Cercophora sp. LCS_1]